MDITATLKLDCGPFAEALAAAMDAVEQLAGESAGLSAAIAEAKANLEGLASGADEAAEAHAEAAESAAGHAEAVADVGESAEVAGGQIGSLKGGMDAAGAAEAVMTGNAKGAAAAMLQLSQSFKTLGISMNAVLGVALVAAVVALCKALSEMKGRAEQLKLDNAFDNAAVSARNLTSEIAKANAELDRQTMLARGLREVESGRLGTQTQIALRKNETERQKALRGASEEDAARINAEYDRKRNQIEHDAAVADAGGDDIKTRISENEAAIAERRAQLEALAARQGEYSRRAMAASRTAADLAPNDFAASWNRNAIERNQADAARYGDLAAGIVDDMKGIASEIKKLEDENKILSAKAGAASEQKALADATLEARNAAIDTSLANARGQVDDPASVTSAPAAVKADGFAGGVADQRISSDRLARIGGFVGGAAAPMRKTEDLLRQGNDIQKQILEATKAGGGASFA